MKIEISFDMCSSQICDYDEAFTRREMYDETGMCKHCKYVLCPSHLLATIRENEKEKTK